MVAAAAAALCRVVAGMEGDAGAPAFRAGIEAGHRVLGNRAFLQWLGALGAGKQAGAVAARNVSVPGRTLTGVPAAEGGPLQMMGKKKKPQGAAQGGVGAGAGPQPVPVSLPKVEPGVGETAARTGPREEAPVEQKKKKKSRVQVALNALRGEGVEAFGGYIEAEIGEAALLRTLVERINRAEDLGGVRAGALSRVEARLRLLDPLLARGAGPGEVAGVAGAVAPERGQVLHASGRGQEPEIAVIAPVKSVFSLREEKLFKACVRGDTGKLILLLKHKNVDINMSRADGTLLCGAAYFGHTGIVKELLSRPGIDVNLAQYPGTTPLYLAVQEGKVKVMELLLDARCINVNLATISGVTPLYIAAENGHPEAVKLLLGAPGINVNPAALTDRSTPLSIAVQHGQEEVVKLLLAAPGIGADSQQDDGATSLLLAAFLGQREIVKQLVNHGADVNLPMHTGETPLSTAVYKGDLEVVRSLLRAPGILLGQQPGRGSPPFGVAVEAGHVEIVRLLLRKGADPHEKFTNAATSLHVACLHGHTAIVEMLLHAGVDTTIEIEVAKGYGYTPFQLAQLAGHRKVMSILAAHRRRREHEPALAEAAPFPAAVTAGQARQSSPTSPAEKDITGPAPARPESVSPAPVPSAGEVPAEMAPTTDPDEPVFPAVSGSRPEQAGPRSPLAQAMDTLRQEVLGKLRADNIDMLEGIRLLRDVNATTGLDGLCALYNKLAHIERQEERSRRGKRPLLPQGRAPCSQPQGRVEAAAPVFALGERTGLDADAVEGVIKRHLDQAYHRFVSQAVNDMEFGRGKPTSGYPGLWHASAGVPGVGSCSVFYYLEESGERIWIVGIGHHVGRAAYGLDYAAGELGGVGRVLHIT